MFERLRFRLLRKQACALEIDTYERGIFDMCNCLTAINDAFDAYYGGEQNAWQKENAQEEG